jgi:hypothetical protein
MAEPHVIRMEELRNAITRSLIAAEERLGSEVALTDDLEHTRQATDVGPETAWHELSHLVGLLHAGERDALS